MNKFISFIARSRFVHNVSSFFVNKIPLFILHNFAKYFCIRKMNFYGFDSFEGFPIEAHDLFKSENFKTDYEMVKKLEKKFSNCTIVKGFFDKTLKDEKISKSINKISFAFVDCDLAHSAKSVFEFIKPRLSYGAYIMIDDYFHIDKNRNSIFQSINEFFEVDKDIFIHSYFGNAGIVFRYFKK